MNEDLKNIIIDIWDKISHFEKVSTSLWTPILTKQWIGSALIIQQMRGNEPRAKNQEEISLIIGEGEKQVKWVNHQLIQKSIGPTSNLSIWRINNLSVGQSWHPYHSMDLWLEFSWKNSSQWNSSGRKDEMNQSWIFKVLWPKIFELSNEKSFE